jgi:acyl-CoA reductase-like NAD-dependent aldehyde dehydrogenase
MKQHALNRPWWLLPPGRRNPLWWWAMAAALVAADYSRRDWAAERIAMFGNYQAGQSCIAVQRVLVDRAVADEFIPKLVTAVRDLRTGDVEHADGQMVRTCVSAAAGPIEIDL